MQTSIRYLSLWAVALATHLPAADMAIPALIPAPAQITMEEGSFAMDRDVAIHCLKDDESLLRTASLMSNEISRVFNGKVRVRQSDRTRGAIALSLNESRDEALGDEGYQLTIAPRGVRLNANTPAGLFYAAQTFAQLLPLQTNSAIALPSLTIVDRPRFRWRGLMLDVSRHFFTKAEVKQFIDDMARYKFNVFHWHLTDDQGWRVEIHQYPKLTEVGAWRVPRQGIWWTFQPPQPGEAATEGGFYTQEDLREVVAYAKERFIEILPEIDVPGHSMAALAAYPELSCTGGPFTVNPGSKFYGSVENSLCAGQEKTYEFLDAVFGELAPIFPFAYFHMGGDEAFHGFWSKCPRCLALRKAHGLANNEQLQSHFVRRVEGLLEKHGKKLIGWDEILMGGLTPTASVMSWRGTAGGIQAAKAGHDVIMTPSPFYYLDLYQGDPQIEPNTYSLGTLRMAYDFEPVPAGVDAARILGVQGNVWAESIPTFRHAQYMTWPRALAVAETAWSPRALKDWNSFAKRTEDHFARLRSRDWNFAPSLYDARAKVTRAADKSIRIALETDAPSVEIHYTFTIANPDAHYPKYDTPLSVPKGASELRVVTTRDGALIGRQINFPIAELEKRAK